MAGQSWSGHLQAGDPEQERASQSKKLDASRKKKEGAAMESQFQTEGLQATLDSHGSKTVTKSQTVFSLASKSTNRSKGTGRGSSS